MSKHEPHHHPQHGSSNGHGPWRPHKDWRFWVAVVLMIAAMVVYVMSMDESLRPWGGVTQPMPAAP